MTKGHNKILLFLLLITLPFHFPAPAKADAPTELMKYNIKYGFINGGEVEFCTRIAEHENKPVYHTRVDAKTTGLIDQLYKLHDVYESYYDMRTGLPELAIQNLSEGKYRHYDEMRYYQDELFAASLKKDTTFPLTGPTYDILSGIQYLRSMDWSNFSDGDTIAITTSYDKEPFPIYVIYKGKETLTIGKYKYESHKFTPIIDPGKILKKRESILIWFSDDENKIPLNIRLNLVVGAFKLELDRAEILSHPFDAQSHKKDKNN